MDAPAFAPVYHKQPHTQDPTKEPPDEDAPLAQGHSPEQAADVAETIANYKQAVEDERQAASDAQEAGEPVPGEPRAPGDHAGEEEPSDPQGFDSHVEGAYPTNGSVDDVLAWVGDDHDRAQEALAQENARSTPRTTLVTKLEQI